MSGYLVQRNAGDIVRGAVAMYREYFLTFVVIGVLPILPTLGWAFFGPDNSDESLATRITAYFSVKELVTHLVEAIPQLAITIAVSDICLGNQPSFMRSYQRLFRLNFALPLMTYLLVQWFIGFAQEVHMLFYPLLLALTMLIGEVVVLERRAGKSALSRNWQLSRGFMLRNLAVFGLVFAAFLVYAFLPSFIVAALAKFGFMEYRPWESFLSVFATLLGSLLFPLVGITTTLIYYDMRVRKEAYDTVALAQDLMR